MRLHVSNPHSKIEEAHRIRIIIRIMRIIMRKTSGAVQKKRL